tara:strand:+ start:991 stop:1458 length:468 start_codon:yes stop_codon:yes gene_type:complete
MKKEINKSLSVKFIDYEVQNGYPSEYKIRKWARRAYLSHNKNSVNIKLASVSEMKSLNKKYFNKTKPCNVLSFPDALSSDHPYFLGDIIICGEVVNRESEIFNVDSDKRWAHMIVHSMLHLQGYDHILKKNQQMMERKEIYLMSQIGFSNPYYEN